MQVDRLRMLDKEGEDAKDVERILEPILSFLRWSCFSYAITSLAA